MPPLHELAKQAGIELPAALGRIEDVDEAKLSPAASRKAPKS